MLMFGDFGEYFTFKKNYIDNSTFRLHYRVTFGVLVVCSVLNTSHQFLGSPIDCMTSAPSTSAVNTYCWIHGTFTLYDKLNATIGHDAIRPGVGPKTYDKDGREIHHAYYQWVAMVLFLQALLCYLPHYLWRMTEGGKITMLIQGLDTITLIDEDDLSDKRKSITDYFIRTLRSHNLYSFRFLFLEFLNLVNVIGQMFLMNKFLGGQFMSYGRDLLTLTDQADFRERDDPLNRVFPKMTKCDFRLYGHSGTIQNFDSLCLLPINIINEKIYVFLWFWFIFVTTFTAVHLLAKFFSLLNRHFRLRLMSHIAPSVNQNDLKVILKKCHYGDWFLLMQVGKFIRPTVFHDILLDLRDRIDRKRACNLDD